MGGDDDPDLRPVRKEVAGSKPTFSPGRVSGIFRTKPKEPTNLSIGVAWPGVRHQLSVTTKTTVLEVKEMVEKVADIPVTEQILEYKKKVLRKGKKTLGKYGIEDDRTLVLTRKTDDAPAKENTSAPSPTPAPTKPTKPIPTLKTSEPNASNPVKSKPTEPEPEDKKPTEPAVQRRDEDGDDVRESHAGITMEVADQAYLDKEEADDIVKFSVKYEKKEYKMKMSKNGDIYGVMMELERMGCGKAGHMRILMDGEELDEEEMLEEAGVENGTKLVLEVDD